MCATWLYKKIKGILLEYPTILILTLTLIPNPNPNLNLTLIPDSNLNPSECGLYSAVALLTLILTLILTVNLTLNLTLILTLIKNGRVF